MKTAVEEIRYALTLARTYACDPVRVSSYAAVRDRCYGAIARLDELEKQIAEAEERGRRAERADLLAYADSDPDVDPRSAIVAGLHVGAAERANGGHHG